MTGIKYVAVVDDEEDTSEIVARSLQSAGFEAKAFTDGRSFLFSLKGRPPDLAILDLNMPEVSGLEICREMKSDAELKHIPIIMLTAMGDVTDRVVGLELGADDYVVKPCNLRELVARVGAVLRRAESKLESKEIQRVGALTLDPERAAVTLKGRPVDLTATEYKILELLTGHVDRLFSRDEILEHVWGYDKPVMDRTVDVHVKRLRAKLGATGRNIKTMRGLGYKFAGGS